MILKPAPVSSSDFIFKNNKFIGEMSEIGRQFKYFGRVYDDACDIGFTIISAKTGKHAVFALEKEVGDENDHEIMAWEFRCVTPGLTNLTAVIFND